MIFRAIWSLIGAAMASRTWKIQKLHGARFHTWRTGFTARLRPRDSRTLACLSSLLWAAVVLFKVNCRFEWTQPVLTRAGWKGASLNLCLECTASLKHKQPAETIVQGQPEAHHNTEHRVQTFNTLYCTGTYQLRITTKLFTYKDWNTG